MYLAKVIYCKYLTFAKFNGPWPLTYIFTWLHKHKLLFVNNIPIKLHHLWTLIPEDMNVNQTPFMLHGIIHVQYIENVHKVYVHVQVPRFWNFNQLKPSLKGYKITISQCNPAYMDSHERGHSPGSFELTFKSTRQTEFQQ